MTYNSEFLHSNDYSRTCYEQPLLLAASLLWESTWPFPQNDILYANAPLYVQPPALKGHFACVTMMATRSRLYCINSLFLNR